MILPQHYCRFLLGSFHWQGVVTLCRWSTKQTIPLSVLARNQTKAWACDLRRDRKWVRECESGVGQRNSEKWVGDGRRRRPINTEHRRDESAWERESSISEGRPVKLSQQNFRQKYTLALVYICIGNAVLHNSSSCTWVDPALVCSLFFPPTPLIIFLVAIKEMWDTPIGSPAKKKWSGGEVDVTGDRGGIVTA